jgi:hypothetical protein
VNAVCVAATLKRCGKKNIERFFGYLSTNEAFTEADDVCVIVRSAQPSRGDIVNRDSTHAVNLICCNADAKPRPADCNAKLGISCGYGPSDSCPKFGVIN